MPCSFGSSSRLPEPTQTPSEAVCRCGMLSVTTVKPGRQTSDFHAHAAAPSRAARLAARMNFSIAP